MKINHLYDFNFPSKHKVKPVDIIALYHERRFEELDAVVVCKDKEGNVTATIFYLKTRGKKRGYIERQEIAHEGVLESKVIEWVPSKE